MSLSGPPALNPATVAVYATFRRTSLSLVPRTATSTVSVCDTSRGTFGSRLNGLRASMVLVMAPMRPPVVCPATRTWYRAMSSDNWNSTLARPDSGRTRTGCQYTVSVKSERTSPSAGSRWWAYSRTANDASRTAWAASWSLFNRSMSPRGPSGVGILLRLAAAERFGFAGRPSAETAAGLTAGGRGTGGTTATGSPLRGASIFGGFTAMPGGGPAGGGGGDANAGRPPPARGPASPLAGPIRPSARHSNSDSAVVMRTFSDGAYFFSPTLISATTRSPTAATDSPAASSGRPRFVGSFAPPRIAAISTRNIRPANRPSTSTFWSDGTYWPTRSSYRSSSARADPTRVWAMLNAVDAPDTFSASSASDTFHATSAAATRSRACSTRGWNSAVTRCSSSLNSSTGALVRCPWATSIRSTSGRSAAFAGATSCSANRRQPCVPSSRSRAVAAFGWSVSRKSACSNSAGCFTSPDRRKCVGISRSVLMSAIVTTLRLTTATSRTAGVGSPFSVAAVRSSRTLPDGPYRDLSGVASSSRCSPLPRYTNRSARGARTGRPAATSFPSSKTVTRVTPPADSSPFREISTGVFASRSSFWWATSRPRAYAPTCSNFGPFGVTSRTRTAPPRGVTASSAVSATPSGFAAGSGYPSGVGSVTPTGEESFR